MNAAHAGLIQGNKILQGRKKNMKRFLFDGRNLRCGLNICKFIFLNKKIKDDVNMSGSSTVLIPARVVHALQVHFDQIAATSGPKASAFPPLRGNNTKFLNCHLLSFSLFIRLFNVLAF